VGGIPLFLEQIAREYTSTGTCMIPRNYTGAGSLPLKIRYLCRRWSLYRSMRDKWPPKCEFTESLLQLDGGRRLFQLLSCFSLPYQARLSLLFLPGTGEGGGVCCLREWEGRNGMIVWNSCPRASPPTGAVAAENGIRNNYLGNNKVTSM